MKVTLPIGETEILCTSLPDDERFPAAIFAELYHHRWTAEESFKMLRSRAELENFSGKTAKAIKQDFHAKLYAITLCSFYAYPIEEKVKAEYGQGQAKKHAQKINRTSALDMLHNILIPSFLKINSKKPLKHSTILSTKQESCYGRKENSLEIISLNESTIWLIKGCEP